MNLLHMKYAVEIAKTNSINKAAETLYVGQSALSRAMKDLEASLGVVLFDRSAKGMFLTPEGESFIRHAEIVLKQVDDIEKMFNGGTVSKKKFSISVPRASYVSYAFTEFSKCLEKKDNIELFYHETNSMHSIKNILQDDYKLGIIRYAENFDKYYKLMLDEKGLESEMIAEFRYVIIASENSELAKLPSIKYEDLSNYIEIAHADLSVPSLPFVQVKKEELPDNITRRIYVVERGSQFELLSKNTETFMWVSPIPDDLLKRYGLVQRVCEDNKRVYKDLIIHRKDYVLSELDNLFISELIKAKRKILK